MIAPKAIPRVALQISPMVLALLLMPAAASAQSYDDVHVAPRTSASDRTKAPSPSGPTSSAKPLRKDVDLVLVPVTVTDPMNRPILNLGAGDFALYEGLVQQNIRYFSHEDAPISVALVLDCSASMKNKIEYEQQALEQFFTNANEEDEYFAVTVSDKPHLIATSTDSVGPLQDRLGASTPKGKTALFDAIYLGVAKLRTARYQRRALLIISDGGDNTSRYTRDEIKRVIENRCTFHLRDRHLR